MTFTKLHLEKYHVFNNVQTFMNFMSLVSTILYLKINV